MIPYGLLLIILLFPGYTTAAIATDQTVTVMGWKLHLIDRAGSCVLEYTKGSITGEFTIVPTPPCRFVDERGIFPQTAQFKTKGKRRTLVIVFGTPYRGPAIDVPAKSVYCGTASQAVMLADKEIRLSMRIAEGGIRCEGYGVDEREFRMFDEEWH